MDLLAIEDPSPPYFDSASLGTFPLITSTAIGPNLGYSDSYGRLGYSS
jgi:hypothetical protein